MGKHEPTNQCATCGGSGKVPITSDGVDERSTRETKCPSCKGTGGTT